MKPSRRRGATLGIVAACVLTLVIIGFAIYFLAKVIGGGKQVANATDAGAISAARQLTAVTTDISAITTWATGTSITPPPELSGLAVNTTAAEGTIGNADSTYALTKYNVFAYNRAAGAALLIAINANQENTPTASENAAITIQNLAVIGNALYNSLVSSSNVATNQDNPNTIAYAFQNVSDSNTTQMDGNQWTQGADGNYHNAALQGTNYGYVGSQAGSPAGKANVYLASATVDGNWNNSTFNASTGANTFNSLAGSGVNFSSGQLYANAYTPINISLPGASSTVYPIFFVNTNPNQFPHLIDLGRFNSSNTDPSAALAISVGGQSPMHLPFNAISGQTKATQATPSQGLADHSQALLTTAIASSVIGANTNVYPMQLSNGYIRITNVADAQYVNGGPVVNQPPTGAQSDNSIFNYELFDGTNGYGGVDSYLSSSSSTPVMSTAGYTQGYVFGTHSGTAEFSGYSSAIDNANVATQIAAWNAYATSGGNANCQSDTANYNNWVSGGSVGPQPVNQYTDSLGLDGTLDPTYGVYGNGGTPVPAATTSPGNTYQNNQWTPNDNAQVVSTTSLTGPGSATDAQAVDMFNSATSSSISCTTTMYQLGTESSYCDAAVAYFAYNYNRYPPNGGSVTGEGTPTGGITDLEYIKGEVIAAYEAMDGAGGYQPGWKAVIGIPPESAADSAASNVFYPSPTKPSGSKVYTRPRYNGDPDAVNYVNYAQATNPGDQLQFGNQANVKEENQAGVTSTYTSAAGPQSAARYIQWFNAVGYDHLLGTGSNTIIPNVCPGGGMDLTNTSSLWTQPSSVQYQLLKRCQQIDPTVTPATLYSNGAGTGLLETVPLDLGQSCFLYLDRSSGKLNVCSSTGTGNAIPSYASTWNWATQQADGNTAASQNLCYDNAWQPTLTGNSSLVVNSAGTSPGCSNCVPGSGDHNLHEQPFTGVSGGLTTFDGVQWNPSSGGNGGLLGELLIQNVSQANGTASPSAITFSGPN